MKARYHIWADPGNRGAALAGVLSGALLVLAFPVPELWPLALVAWVPVLRWIAACAPRPRHGFAAGWIAGFVVHAVVHSPLVFTAREMSRLPAPVGVLVVAVVSAAMALHQGLFGALAAATVRPAVAPLRRAAELGMLMAVCEFALPWLFRWHLGNAVYRAPLWMQLADVIGVVGVSGCMTAVAALAADGWQHRRARSLAVAAAVIALWAGYGALRLHQVDAAPRSGRWRAIVVQQNATLAEKKALEAVRRIPALDRLEQMTRAAARDGQLRGADAVVWPEGAFPFFWVTDDVSPGAKVQKSKANNWLLNSKRRVLALSRELPVPLLLGTLRRFDPMWRQEARNSAIVVDRGSETWGYDKQILLAFGEYLPGTGLFPSLKEAVPGVSNFDPGTTSGLVRLGGALVLVNICYEALFPDFMRREAKDAQVLVNLTNDVWFGPAPAPDMHLMVQQARAVELRRPLVRSTVSGISAHIDAGGRFVAELGFDRRGLLVADVALADIGSPYRLWGDAPMWAITAMVVGWLAWLWRRRRVS